MTGLNPGEPKWQLTLLQVIGYGLGVIGFVLTGYLLAWLVVYLVTGGAA